ncbi:MAG TPA: hypothetical protein DCZ95_09040 [Verrucomicrobia bacterium]|nr:MAG: hypothetical protein A2X46_03225 [Lentisphaerae bacterium GWF2_57_35]HBA84222.1 hypothetical protein [Verrucomicrobiota bacterium]
MLRSAKEVLGYYIHATDDVMGKVDDFLFDDASWAIRYVVVDTGNWLPGRLVVLAPAALGQPDWAHQTMTVKLSKNQIENSPSLAQHQPISRQQELKLHEYYMWAPYWSQYTTSMQPPAPAMALVQKAPTDAGEEQERQHLHSMREVIGYNIHASDGGIGHVEDFIIGDDTWKIQYLIIDTKNWLPGKKVILPPDWAHQVDWYEKSIYVDLTKKVIQSAPEYDPSTPINRDYEQRMYDYYGRPRYWTKT